jgi:hypothetical protein
MINEEIRKTGTESLFFFPVFLLSSFNLLGLRLRRPSVSSVKIRVCFFCVRRGAAVAGRGRRRRWGGVDSSGGAFGERALPSGVRELREIRGACFPKSAVPRLSRRQSRRSIDDDERSTARKWRSTGRD